MVDEAEEAEAGMLRSLDLLEGLWKILGSWRVSDLNFRKNLPVVMDF